MTPTAVNIRDQIVTKRRERISREGHTLGSRVPDQRELPIIPFLRDPPVICEIKRRSPSRGTIASDLDPVDRAGRYVRAGIQSISVLTEEDHFAGSLGDLMAIKQAFPDVAVLRKDFLLDEEDIRVSYRAGADGVLLIASILSPDELVWLHRAAVELGMAALVELHDTDDFEKARRIMPDLVGINARDLTTFHVDLLTPVTLHHHVNWPHRAVFESGVRSEEDALLVRGSGFDGVLVGEAAVRDEKTIPGIVRGMTGLFDKEGDRQTPVQEAQFPAGGDSLERDRHTPAVHLRAIHPRADFWSRLMERVQPVRPLVKICGITNRRDAELAVELGADILGFVFADSPRRADVGVVRSLADLPVLKAAIVVTGGTHGSLSDEIAVMLTDGLIDVIQFHGDEQPEECFEQAFPYYKALRVGGRGRSGDPGKSGDPQKSDRSRLAVLLAAYRCPRILVDARDKAAYGGTGKQIAGEVVAEVKKIGPLWLAGGLNDGNVAQTIIDFHPELIDASSGLESEPGQKDPEKLKRYFQEITRVQSL